MKAVVWVGPYCWLRGSDHDRPALRRYLETKGNVSLMQHFRDTCRVCRGLEAESQMRAQPPSPDHPLPPSVHNSPCLLSLSPSFPLPLSLPKLSPFTPTLSLCFHPLPLPTWPPPTLHLSIFQLFTPLSPAPPSSAAPGIGKEFSCVAC